MVRRAVFYTYLGFAVLTLLYFILLGISHR
jgi:hypothetical protein